MNENREHCKVIAEALEKYYNGEVYRCTECGDIVEPNNNEEECFTCGGELEQLSLYDYLDMDVFDIEYRLDSTKQLTSVRIMIACGGPNIYIDTASRAVELYWWGDRASYPIDRNVCEEIDRVFEEIFNC